MSHAKFTVICMVLSMMIGCAQFPLDSREKPDDQNLPVPALETRHTSVFNHISYRIPNGWVVVDGESDWIAPGTEKHFWQPGFDPEKDAYYTVSVIFPHLTMEDMAEKRLRRLEELTNATRHSLEVAVNARILGGPFFIRINDHRASVISAQIDGGQYFHQVFVQLHADEVASVAGSGPYGKRQEIRALVDGIATTVKSGRASSMAQ